ncbi:hypothetical protein [Arthrobacter sp. BE255]|uniref:hypothetical protein n=1 Tax=Arthrobacter sp. BE255 TaxID=2817721 RepID=UPI00286D65E5|nr:hypothetical protein [Arthrobacter sp. BE255]
MSQTDWMSLFVMDDPHRRWDALGGYFFCRMAPSLQAESSPTRVSRFPTGSNSQGSKVAGYLVGHYPAFAGMMRAASAGAGTSDLRGLRLLRQLGAFSILPVEYPQQSQEL